MADSRFGCCELPCAVRALKRICRWDGRLCIGPALAPVVYYRRAGRQDSPARRTPAGSPDMASRPSHAPRSIRPTLAAAVLALLASSPAVVPAQQPAPTPTASSIYDGLPPERDPRNPYLSREDRMRLQEELIRGASSAARRGASRKRARPPSVSVRRRWRRRTGASSSRPPPDTGRSSPGCAAAASDGPAFRNAFRGASSHSG